ncbi:MAG: methyltransferase family protein [Candidatus Hodarchaeota archaeon]
MGMRDFLKRITEILLKIFNIWIVYSSVLAGILFPMLIIYGFFTFLLYFWEFSWIFADPTIIQQYFYTTWLNTYLDCPLIWTKFFDIIKILIFLAGLIIFLVSLGQLTYGLRKNRNIVQKGFYKYIRHPQNLSIIIMAFTFFIHEGIRIGDLISWIQFTFLIIIYSDLADIRLKKKFLEGFQDYYENTGFMFPKLLPYKVTKYISVFTNKKLRYFLMFLIYIGLIRLCYLIYIIFPFYHLYI